VDKIIANVAGRTIEESSIEQFKLGLRGKLLRPGDDDYDSSRRVFNAMIDKHPALIARCAGVADVIQAVNFARQNNLVVAVRGGGHNVAGNAMCDGGLVIDLSNLKGIRVDPARRTAQAEAGATLGEFDHETQAHEQGTTLGVFSPTGIAGLTLGGGYGWLAGKYGLASDNLLSADVVTAEGKLISANSEENQDLFWGLRGGGGNFGVVTSFTYKLHPVSRVLAGSVAWPIARTGEVLHFLRDFTSQVPDELGLVAALFTTPDDIPIVGITVCYAGPIEEGERVLAPTRKFGPPLVDTIGPMKYVQVQKMLDPLLPWGLYNYWKSAFFKDLSEPIIDTIETYAKTCPSLNTFIMIELYSGAASRVPPDATAFNHRGKLYNFSILSVWKNPADSERNLEWTRTFWNSIQPFLSNRVYVNYLSQEGEERVRAAYGNNYERLEILKKKYDPSNLFRVNQNIKPPVPIPAQ